MKTSVPMLQKTRKDTFASPHLGYKVGRVNDVVYHLEHARGENSWFSNPHMQSNMNEWDKISKMDKKNF